MIAPVQQTYSITVETIKYSVPYSYSATDTVQDLKGKIYENEGLPAEQQRLLVQYGWRRLWETVDISARTNDLLIDHLQTASKIKLFIRLPHNSTTMD